MLINVASLDPTIYIFISDGGASVLLGKFCEESKPPEVTKINQENFVANFATCINASKFSFFMQLTYQRYCYQEKFKISLLAK
jgi:hypothetical protein